LQAVHLRHEGKGTDSPSEINSVKRLRYLNGALDALDVAILRLLSENARTPIKDIAGRIGLSGPSTTERLRRLEETGVVEGYQVRINAQAIGLPLAVHIRLRPMPGELTRVAKLLIATPEIIESDRVTGDDCFVARALVANVGDLEALIDRFLPFATTNTAIIQSSPVARRMASLPEIPARLGRRR
jgi:Lrp/AsnC family transcriptional regulator, leucine-responsive regulatory protein